MSFLPKNERMARNMSAALVFPDRSTSSNARSASCPQCQVSSNASICACDRTPPGERNSTL